MGIPVASVTAASRLGSKDKIVKCEACGETYAYGVNRVGVGKGVSALHLDNAGASQRAYETAERKLADELSKAVEIVPCPHCGWYQSDMFPLVRKNYYKGLLNFTIVLFVAAAGVMVAGVGVTDHAAHESVPSWSWIGMLVIGFVASAMLLIRQRLCLSVDPNEEPQSERLALAEKALNEFPPSDPSLNVRRSASRRQDAEAEVENLRLQLEGRLKSATLSSAIFSSGNILKDVVFGTMFLSALPLLYGFSIQQGDDLHKGLVANTIALSLSAFGVFVAFRIVSVARKKQDLIRTGELTTGTVHSTAGGESAVVTFHYDVAGTAYVNQSHIPDCCHIHERVCVVFDPIDPRQSTLVDNLFPKECLAYVKAKRTAASLGSD